MSTFFIGPSIGYHGGDPQSGDTECPQRPNEFSIFNNGEWIPNLPEARNAVRILIKAERDRRTQAGGYKVVIGGIDKWFNSDVFSRSQQIGLVILGANMPVGIQWKTMDGTFVTMTPTLAQQIFGAAAASDIALFHVAETHLLSMEASSDPLAYDFSTGWPLIFGE